MQNYLLLEKEMEEINRLNNIAGILSWDIAVNVPVKSAESRSEEIALLGSLIHSRLKSDKIIKLIADIQPEIKELDNWQLANLQEIEKNIKYIRAISDELQKNYILASTKCELVWREAKKSNEFNKLKPYLEQVLIYVEQIGQARASVLNSSSYDALIDMYDPGRKSVDIDQVFTSLKAELPNLIHQIVDKQRSENLLPVARISAEQQKLISKKIIQTMEFDFDYGRLDESAHPFCGGTAFDVRLTNRYNEDNFLSGIMGAIHEAGHGLYEQNLPINYKNQPVGKARGMAVHESQSLFMEMQVARSRAFSEFLAKLLRDEFNFTGEQYSAENLYKLKTRVKPGFIRVDADEVTYPMHVILRFEIEQLLINKELQLEEVPHIWNKKMQEYLGITPPTDREGCLQDIHWPSGGFGYFPAYTNGAIIAAMLMNKIRTTNPDIDKDIAQGKFTYLNEFLNDRIRKHGSLKSSDELIGSATSEKRNPQIFLDYLRQKYLN